MSASPLGDALARVEAELASFWSAPDTSAGDAKAKVRASTLNFVAAASPGEIPRLRDETEALAGTHAGRAFLLFTDGRIAPWDAVTDVHAVCSVDGSVPICHDRVEIGFGAMAALRAASVVRSLALPEIPIVVESAAGAPSSLVDALVPIAHRLIVDSARAPIARIADLIRRSAGPVADRAFVRTFSFRELVARFFDHAPEALRAIRRLTIGRTPGGRQEPAALFIGWMSSRLGWTFTSRGAATDAAGEPVAIEVVDEALKDIDPGVITSVCIAAEVGGEPLVFGCARTDAPGIVRWTVESGGGAGAGGGPRTTAHEHRLGYHDELWVLVKALDAKEGDRVYREAALAAAAWSAL